MSVSSLLNDYQKWRRFQRQDSLDREHDAALRKLAESGAIASRMTEAYRSMASRGASEGACYRTLFRRQLEDNHALACEGWLFIRRVLAEGGTTRIRATMVETFNLEEGFVTLGKRPAEAITLEIYDEILTQRGMLMRCRADRQDKQGETHFITFLDSVRGDLKPYL
ncbi:hypothetical protein [Phytohalomonas tamaricis]|uniref:hypothetical protein n=1 Tax=Phytohalomonas tamaricis TaxID=2081032 RepID=UPI000D0ABA4D|nr:hypothetical protein [Phytohalomonas tamaricis]